MRRLAWTFAARIGYKYQIRLTRSKYVFWIFFSENFAETLVVSLCKSKGDVLDKFVSDMLDYNSK